jgi:hypothetical protein
MAKNCAKCGKKLGFLDVTLTLLETGEEVCENCFQEQRIRAEQEAQKKKEQRAQAIQKIILSTGDFKEPYEILDTIIAIDAHEAGYFSSAKPSTAFDGVKNQLRTLAYDMGADAVICCQFEYRVAVGQGLFGSKQAIEIFAYGTAVKLQKEKTTTNGGQP